MQRSARVLGARVLTVTVLLALAAGCAREIDVHGYAPAPAEVAEIQVGQDTRSSVRQKIGRPSVTGVFTPDSWYYVSTEIENYLFYEPKVASRRVVAVTFDQNDLVASVNEYGMEDGRVVDLATRTTPTLGRELTILQQILGNIGVITAEDLAE